MLSILLLMLAQHQGGPGDDIPPNSPPPEMEQAAKENRSLLVISTSADEARKAEVAALLKHSAIRREIQYEFVVTYRPGPARPGGPPMTSMSFWDSSGKPGKNLPYEQLLTSAGKPDAQKFLDLLKQNESTPLDALKVLESARQTALQEKKRLFIHLGAPW